MRFKLGRPDISLYRNRFDVPDADPDAALALTWLGVSTLLVDDGTCALLTDGFFSRPSLLDVGLRRLTPSASRIDYCLNRAKINRLAAVLPVHTHYDHAMDSALVAARTGARLVGGESAANIGRGHGLSDDQIVVAASGDELSLGAVHRDPHRIAPLPAGPLPPRLDHRPPGGAAGESLGVSLRRSVVHVDPPRASDRRLLIQGSAGFLPGALDGRHAEIAYLGVGQLGVQPQAYIEQYWEQTVRAVGARRVVLIHWDDFFRPLTEPMIALPYAGDDLNVTMRVLSRLAEKGRCRFASADRVAALGPVGLTALC